MHEATPASLPVVPDDRIVWLVAWPLGSTLKSRVALVQSAAQRDLAFGRSVLPVLLFASRRAPSIGPPMPPQMFATICTTYSGQGEGLANWLI